MPTIWTLEFALAVPEREPDGTLRPAQNDVQPDLADQATLAVVEYEPKVGGEALTLGRG